MVPAEIGSGARPSRYELAAGVQQYVRHQQVAITGSLEKPADQRDRATAEWTNLRIAKERGLLIPIADAVAEGQAFIVAAGGKIRALTSRLVRAGLLREEDKPRADEFVREALEEISRWRTRADLAAASRETAE